MSSNVRDCVLAAVAGIRSEKRAASQNVRSVARRTALGAYAVKSAQALPQQVADNFPARGGTRAIGNDFVERAGQWLTLGEGAALGTALGSQRANRWLGKFRLRGFKGRGIGALAGLSAGMLTNLAGRGKAFFTKGRTSQDQLDHDRVFRVGSLFTPGSGAYNSAKRQERVQLSRWHG
jgi:hypothetical protein